MKLASKLYTGEVEHRRFMPVKNSFTYSVCYFFIDLDEVDSIFKYPLLLSHNFPGLLSFWRKDYFGDKSSTITESIKNLVYEKTQRRVSGPIRLMTNISYLGFCFNPVSFYYCYKEDGKTLEFIVSEITNTPWGERHPQVFEAFDVKKHVFRFKKDFHVSPFIPMNIDYTWIFNSPDEELYVHMQDRMKDQTAVLFDSTLRLKQQPLTGLNVSKIFFLYPFITLKTLAAIYYQALKLYIKKAPFYAHPMKEKGV